MDAGHEPAAGGTSERAAKKRARGTVAMNGLALNQARVDRGWTQEALAEKVGVNLRTLQRAEAGQPVERETAGWIAEALGIPLLMLLKDAPSLASAAGGTPPKGRETVEIVLNIDPGKCSSAELPRLVSNAVAELSDNVLVQGVVLLVRVVMGSIRIILEVDKEDADRLLEAFKKGELAYLDVANVTLASRQRPSHLYPAFLCFLSIGCAFLAIIPAIRVYAAGVGLALGVIALIFFYKRKAWWIMAILAAVLNAAILSLALCGALAKSGQAPEDAPAQDTGDHETTKKAEEPSEPEGTKKEEKPEAPGDQKDDDVTKAVEKVKAAELKYADKPVEIKKEVIAAIIKWGNASKLTNKSFKTTAKKLTANQTSLPGEVNCGTETGLMGSVGGYTVFGATTGRSQGFAIQERKGRLVLFIPFDEDGFGTPQVVTGEDDKPDYRYRTPKDAETSGYFLVKQGNK